LSVDPARLSVIPDVTNVKKAPAVAMLQFRVCCQAGNNLKEMEWRA
jgi:hypothetical protein